MENEPKLNLNFTVNKQIVLLIILDIRLFDVLELCCIKCADKLIKENLIFFL